MSRARVVEAGPAELRRRHWSGWGPVTKVEFSPDDGQSWVDCDLHADNGPYAWRSLGTEHVWAQCELQGQPSFVVLLDPTFHPWSAPRKTTSTAPGAPPRRLPAGP